MQASEPDVQLPLLAEAGRLVVSRDVFCTFELVGEPRAWERPGAVIRYTRARNAYIHWYTRTQEAEYRKLLAWVAKSVMRSRAPTWRPVAVLLHAFLPIPASWHWKRKQAARIGAILPTGPPDWDNFGKILDALTGVVWTDDAGVVDGRVIKRFSDRPALRCEVREFVPPK